MSEEFEGRWRMQEEEIFGLSRSRSSSLHVDISDSGYAEEMSEKHYKLGAKPKWSAHADWPDLSEDSSTTPNPPWRDKSLWRIITTQTVEGLLSDQPNQGVKQNFQGLYEALSRKHTMGYARLTKDYEEMAHASGKENKEEGSKDQELHRKMEEMISMMKDMADITNVCTSDPRYQEMLSFVTVKARRDMKERAEEESAASREEVSIVGESSKKNDEAQEKMEQQPSTLLSDKRSEDEKEVRRANSWELINPR